MESQSLQQLVKKVFSDKATRDEFINNPDTVLSRYSLTEQERQAVLKTNTKLGLVSENSIQLDEVIDPNTQWM